MSIQAQLALGKLFDPSFRADPYPVLAELRELTPCVIPAVQTVVVGRYAHADQVLRDRTMSSVRPDSPSFFSLDPPEHTRLRGLTAKVFTAAVVQRLEGRVRELTAELVAGLAGRDSFDLPQELGYELTGRVVCELFGLPYADRAVFRDWTRILATAIDPQMFYDPEFSASVEKARADFREYFRPLVHARRKDPGDDLVSGLVHVRDGELSLSEDDILETCVLFAVANEENPVGLLCNTVLALLRHRDQWAELRADPALAAAAVEETLRYDPPSQLTGRTTTRTLVLGDVRVRAGFAVLVLIAAANRDPDQFPQPDRFDLRRGTTKHLGFAAGPHFCMGADLGRIGPRIVVEELARRMPDLKVIDDSLQYRPNVSVRGPMHMRVAVGSGAR